MQAPIRIDVYSANYTFHNTYFLTTKFWLPKNPSNRQKVFASLIRMSFLGFQAFSQRMSCGKHSDSAQQEWFDLMERSLAPALIRTAN